MSLIKNRSGSDLCFALALSFTRDLPSTAIMVFKVSLTVSPLVSFKQSKKQLSRPVYRLQFLVSLLLYIMDIMLKDMENEVCKK